MPRFRNFIWSILPNAIWRTPSRIIVTFCYRLRKLADLRLAGFTDLEINLNFAPP